MRAAIELVRQAAHEPLSLARSRQEQQILARLEPLLNTYRTNSQIEGEAVSEELKT